MAVAGEGWQMSDLLEEYSPGLCTTRLLSLGEKSIPLRSLLHCCFALIPFSLPAEEVSAAMCVKDSKTQEGTESDALTQEHPDCEVGEGTHRRQ